MAEPGIDYAGLAQQARGSAPATVDYGALAQQARGEGQAQGFTAGTQGDEDMIRGAGFDPNVVKASSRYQAMVKHYGSIGGYMKANPSGGTGNDKETNAPVVAQLSDMEHGVELPFHGLLQLARHGLNKLGVISDADTAYSDMMLRLQNQDYVQNVRHGQASPTLLTLGNMLFPMPGGGASNTALGAVGKGVLQGGAAAAMQPVVEGNPADYWKQKGLQAGTGAAIGGAVPAAVAGATKVGTKVANAVSGNVPAEAQQLMDAGAANKVRLLPGDITRNPTQQKAEVLLESVPVVGTGAQRAAQQTEAKTAAQNLQRSYWDKFIDTDPEAFKDVTDAAASGDQRAKVLIDKLQNAGSDPDKSLQASIGLADFRTRQQATQLYSNVSDLLDKNSMGNTNVPLTATQNALKRAMSQAQISKLPNREVLGVLGEIDKNIQPKPLPAPGPVPTNIRDYQAWQQAQQAAQAANQPTNTYRALRETLSDLDERIRGLMQGENAIIGEKGIAQLEQVRNGLESDLQAFARNSNKPEIIGAQNAADQYYRTARVPFKDGMLASAAISTEPDQIFQQFIKAGKGDRAQKFYDALDARGKAAVRYSMVANAYNTAYDAGKDVFSPQKFFTAMDKLSDASGVFFKGADKFEIDGFKNLMAHVTRAGQFAENPPTGNRTIPLLWTALAGGGAVAAHMAGTLPEYGAAIGLLGMAKPLMMSDAGKRFLLAASHAKPGSPMMQALWEKAMQELPAMASRAANQPQQQQ